MREDGHSIPIQDIRIIHKMVIARILFLKLFVLVGYEIFMDAEIGRNIGFFNNKNDLSMSWSNAHSFARHVRENPDRYTITNDLSTLTP